MHPTIIPFGDEHIEAAAQLLAARQHANRIAEPALPARFEHPAEARSVLESIWRTPHACGVVALEHGQLVGYLIGTPQIDSARGRTAWIRYAGHALAADQSAELYRDLYAVLSPQWLALGCFAHYALIPASDRATLDAWFALSFGLEQAHGIREIPADDDNALATSTATPAPFEIRRAAPDDLEALEEVIGLVSEHQAGPPVYAPTLPEHHTTRRTDTAELLSDPDATVWLAAHANSILGFQIYLPAEANGNLFIPERCIELHLAATRPELRSQGIAQALTARGLAWARTAGYAHCETDWRATNLLSSRFWPRQGFRPVAYRLARLLDERIAWAHA